MLRLVTAIAIALLLGVGTLAIALSTTPTTTPRVQCLIPSTGAGYQLDEVNGVTQSAIHCVNLPRNATNQELDTPLYAGECYARDTTYVPCIILPR